MNKIYRKTAIVLNELVFRTRSTPVAIAIRTLFPMERKVVDSKHGQFLIDPLSHFGYFILRDGEYEPNLSHLVERNLRAGDTAIDCGAHEGYFSVLASRKVGPSGRVIACEPQSRARAILLQNLKLNGIQNVTVLPYAVSDSKGTATIHLTTGHNTGGSGLSKGTSRLPEKTESVETRTLADIASELHLNSIGLIKMDIEGFEFEAVLGSPSLFLSHTVKNLALELHAKHIEMRGLDPTTPR